jgi:uncharacterized protein (DUF433 family)
MYNLTAPALDLSKYIDATIFGDRPHIRGRRIPVAVIVYTARDNDLTLEELAEGFSLTEAETLAALLYYDQRAEEIEAQEAAIHEQYRHFYE